MSHYETNLNKNDANYVPLTPLTFLKRAYEIYPNYEAVIYEDRKYTWSQVYKRTVKFASALNKIGVSKGDTVSFLAFNTPEIFEGHYSVPMTGAVLNTINIRLDAKTIAYILEHSEAKVLVVDRQLHVEVKKALSALKRKITIIDIDDKFADQSKCEKIGELEYESFLNTGDENYNWKMPEDEWQALSLSYTSGTTGNPKGVVYHHRGSYLMSTGSAVAWNMPNRLNFLTIVPMFHCNGWGYPWTVPMLNGRTICLRNIDVKKIFELIDKYDVTHFGGAPIVLNMITGAPASDRKKLKQKVYVLTAGAPPPSIIFKKMKELGFEVMHVYGLTETYGHVTQCAWNDSWNEFDEEKQNEIKARQGVRYPNTEGITVMDPESMKEVPKDGKTIGEIMIKYFSSIPQTMWWSIITLTTVGYGDVSPITPLGQVFGAITAVMGVMSVALLTGIVASGFSSQMSRRKQIVEAEIAEALSDGVISEEEEKHIEELRKKLNLSEEHVESITEILKHERENK